MSADGSRRSHSIRNGRGAIPTPTNAMASCYRAPPGSTRQSHRSRFAVAKRRERLFLDLALHASHAPRESHWASNSSAVCKLRYIYGNGSPPSSPGVVHIVRSKLRLQRSPTAPKATDRLGRGIHRSEPRQHPAPTGSPTASQPLPGRARKYHAVSIAAWEESIDSETHGELIGQMASSTFVTRRVKSTI